MANKIFQTLLTTYTSQRLLQWLFSLKEHNSKFVRWRLKLEQHDYDIVYKKEKFNTNADSLLRTFTKRANARK